MDLDHLQMINNKVVSGWSIKNKCFVNSQNCIPLNLKLNIQPIIKELGKDSGINPPPFVSIWMTDENDILLKKEKSNDCKEIIRSIIVWNKIINIRKMDPIKFKE